MAGRGQRQDLFLIRREAPEPRTLTEDSRVDGAPRWSPDGQQIAYSSNRSGVFEIWTIRPDGSGDRQLTHAGGAAVGYPLWSPDGTHLLYNVAGGGPMLIETGRPWAEQSPQALPAPGPGEGFTAWSYSLDGRRLAGWRRRPDGQSAGIALYDLAAQRFETLTESGLQPTWLRDGRRLVYLDKGELFLIETDSRATRRVSAGSSQGGIGSFAISADERWLCLVLRTRKADIWMAQSPP